MDQKSEETIELAYDHRGLAPMVQEFHQSFPEGRKPSMTGTDGIDDLTLELKAYESMEVGAALPLSQLKN